MLQIKFSSADLSKMAAALAKGEPIPPPEGGWDMQSALALMGVMHSVAFQSCVRPLKTPLDEMTEQERADRMRLEKAALDDIYATVEFYSLGVMPFVQAGVYHDVFEEVVSGAMGAQWKDYIGGLKGVKELDAGQRSLNYLAAQQPPSQN